MKNVCSDPFRVQRTEENRLGDYENIVFCARILLCAHDGLE